MIGMVETAGAPAQGNAEAAAKILGIFLPIAALTGIVLGAFAEDHGPGEQPETLLMREISDDLLIDHPAALKDVVVDPYSSQLSYLNLMSGEHIATASERFACPALSLAKLYIADYVLEHGTPQQRAQALDMLKDSDDKAAEQLYARYPGSIDATAKKYGLKSTTAESRWGYALTSSFDAVSYLSQLLRDDPDSPILKALEGHDANAADGTRQDFGTDRLDGVIGTKWGWSNEKELHSSVSFGRTKNGDLFVVAAFTQGSANDLTRFVERQLGAAD